MFESVAKLNIENQRAETQISKLELDLKEHKLRIQKLYKSNARHNDDYKRVVKTLNLTNRLKSKLQRELDEAKLRIQDLQRSNTRYRDDYEKVAKSLYLANASESKLQQELDEMKRTSEEQQKKLAELNLSTSKHSRTQHENEASVKARASYSPSRRTLRPQSPPAQRGQRSSTNRSRRSHRVLNPSPSGNISQVASPSGSRRSRLAGWLSKRTSRARSPSQEGVGLTNALTISRRGSSARSRPILTRPSSVSEGTRPASSSGRKSRSRAGSLPEIRSSRPPSLSKRRRTSQIPVQFAENAGNAEIIFNFRTLGTFINHHAAQFYPENISYVQRHIGEKILERTFNQNSDDVKAVSSEISAGLEYLVIDPKDSSSRRDHLDELCSFGKTLSKSICSHPSDWVIGPWDHPGVVYPSFLEDGVEVVKRVVA
ncbi:MAG: hypothetical protein M1813_002379 [Trichoglossum hirsutum]|nr:MAG: hypothetical protein M1813_002379 [Trichoglossum hirsutum]